jgi:UDP-3-O-[3-hydroxymyristoyl] glucosamine N-acyltransferase
MAKHTAESADIDAGVRIGDGTSFWHLAQVRDGAVLGAGCVVGRGASIGPGVVIGDKVELQNCDLVHEPARVADGVFIGPAAVFTNDRFPRAENPDGTPEAVSDWQTGPDALEELP